MPTWRPSHTSRLSRWRTYVAIERGFVDLRAGAVFAVPARMRKPPRGMTLLEIMIVLAILALVMGLLVGPKVIAHFRSSQRSIAKMAVMRFANQDYPIWAIQHPQTPCPSAITDLDRDAPADPWGTAYKAYCAPIHEVAFGAASFGGDARENTDDDIRSWQ
jgi:prepilin-type N-terminal cleavage/methylation domain-containing protein